MCVLPISVGPCGFPSSLFFSSINTVFDLDFATVIPDSTAREAFSAAIWEALEKAGISSALRDSFILREGSIVASVDVTSASEESRLLNLIRQGDFKITVKTDPAKSAVTETVSAMTFDQFQASRDSGGGKSSIIPIIACVVGGVVLVAIIVFVVMRRKKSSK